jgi:hypothetical protein
MGKALLALVADGLDDAKPRLGRLLRERARRRGRAPHDVVERRRLHRAHPRNRMPAGHRRHTAGRKPSDQLRNRGSRCRHLSYPRSPWPQRRYRASVSPGTAGYAAVCTRSRGRRYRVLSKPVFEGQGCARWTSIRTVVQPLHGSFPCWCERDGQLAIGADLPVVDGAARRLGVGRRAVPLGGARGHDRSNERQQRRPATVPETTHEVEAESSDLTSSESTSSEEPDIHSIMTGVSLVDGLRVAVRPNRSAFGRSRPALRRQSLV